AGGALSLQPGREWAAPRRALARFVGADAPPVRATGDGDPRPLRRGDRAHHARQQLARPALGDEGAGERVLPQPAGDCGSGMHATGLDHGRNRGRCAPGRPGGLQPARQRQLLGGGAPGPRHREAARDLPPQARAGRRNALARHHRGTRGLLSNLAVQSWGRASPSVFEMVFRSGRPCDAGAVICPKSGAVEEMLLRADASPCDVQVVNRIAALLGATDQAWEYFGRTEPYFGVLTQPAYQMGQLSEAARIEFFESGRRYVEFALEVARNHLDPTFRPARALDFGCGVGRLAIPLARVCESVIGVDVSDAMLTEARKNSQEQGA